MAIVKVKEINLERGFPTVDVAMKRMVNELLTAKMSGCKAVILIHGYGSTGQGGEIKKQLAKGLQQPSLRGIVKSYVKGEEWYQEKNTFLNYCPQLKEFANYIRDNKGLTVVLLK